MYKINKYTPSQIAMLEPIWKELEKGQDMTYFQTYDWYAMLSKIWDVSEPWMETVILSVTEDETPVLIAPFIIVKRTYHLVNKKGVYFWGRNGWSDYLNLVYNRFDSIAAGAAIDYVKKEYGIKRFVFEQVRESTAFYSYVSENTMYTLVGLTNCVALRLPSLVDDYKKILSKHARQNIRTANNRALKDGINFRFCYDDEGVDKELCRTMRQKRVVAKRKAVYGEMNFVHKLSFRIKEKLFFHYPEYLPFYADENSKMLTVYDGETLCGFFNYGIDKHHKTIVLMAVGTNESYAKYSPGILALYSFICSKIEEKDIECLDFTRGDEPYKFALGGVIS